MKYKFAFGRASEDLFFVTTQPAGRDAVGPAGRSRLTTFAHEDEFLALLIAAGLPDDETARLASAVLKSVARPIAPPPWTESELAPHQIEALCLAGTSAIDAGCVSARQDDPSPRAAPSGLLPRFYDLLMQAPAPTAMLVGPEHRFSLLNDQFVRLLGSTSGEKLLGKSMLEAFPELAGDPCMEKLDRVYETGRSWTGKDVQTTFYRETKGTYQQGYFNVVYQPVTNALGEVSGIMVQASDVTDVVLARSVQGAREALLYRQWAELESIYRSAPIGLLLMESKEFRILKLNARQAEIIGASVEELLGAPILSAGYELPGVREMFAAVAAGACVTNQIFEGRLSASPDVLRRWLVSLAPVYAANGQVEAITLVSQEVFAETAETAEDSAAKPYAMAQ